MAKFTREKAKEVAKQALAFKRNYGSYTVLVIGDNGFRTLQTKLVPSELVEDGREHRMLKGNYNNNVVLLTLTDLQIGGVQVDTQKELENLLYKKVNDEINEIIRYQVDKIAQETIGGLENYFR